MSRKSLARRIVRRALPIAFAVSLLAPTGAGAATLSSSFNSDAEGWKVQGNDTSTSTPQDATFFGADGNPAGSAGATDAVSDTGVLAFPWLLESPPAWAGDRRANYGGTVSFDVQPTAANKAPTVILVVADSTGVQRELWHTFTTTPPASTWTHYSVEVKESAPDGWTYWDSSTPPDGRPATAQDFQNVLGGMTNFVLDGDLNWGTTGETVKFDNILLTQPPVPPDSDGDGVPDAFDQCPTQPGPASNNGCPLPAPSPGTTGRTIKRTLSISYAHGAFKGAVRPAGGCAGAETVKVYKVKKGRDPVAGKDKTNARGVYKVAKRNAHGRYYAKVVGSASGADTCLVAKSKTIKAG